MTKKLIVLCLSLMVVALAWGGTAWAGGKAPYKIGAILAVTGPASFLGEPERNTWSWWPGASTRPGA